MTLSEAPTSTVQVSYRTIFGTASTDQDFTDEASTLTFQAGVTSRIVTINVQDIDTLDETDEAVVLELFNPTGGAELAGGQETLRATGFILDDDGSNADRALFVSDARIVEGDAGETLAVFEIELSSPSASAITLNYATSDGSAVAGEDYQAQSGSITFDPGETFQSVAVPVFGDTVLEPTEVFSLVVQPNGAINNGVEGAVGEAEILDDDASGGPVISISGGRVVESCLLYTSPSPRDS